MRVNVYAEEMTDKVEVISKEIDGDDDSSAVTFWGKRDLRRVLAKALQLLDEHYDGKEKT